MYEKAIVEVIEVIDHMENDMTRKIPNDFMQVLYQNADPNYKFEYDETKDFMGQKLSEDARIILSIIFLKYIANAKEKDDIEGLIKENDERLMDVFGNNRVKKAVEKSNLKVEEINPEETMEELDKTVQLVKSEKKWYERIIDKIKEIFKSNKKA